MEILLLLLVLLAAYIGLIRIGARGLRAPGCRPWVAWAYWGSLGFVLLCWLTYTFGGWIPRFPILFIVVFVGSGWLAGVRARLGAVSAGLGGWLTVHSWCCLPVALLLALGWVLVIRYEPVYRDDNMAVVVSDDTGLRSNDQSWKLTFYQNRSELFEVELGRTSTYSHQGRELWRDEWWRDVRAVSLDTHTQTVTIRKCCGQQPLTLNYQQP